MVVQDVQYTKKKFFVAIRPCELLGQFNVFVVQ